MMSTLSCGTSDRPRSSALLLRGLALCLFVLIATAGCETGQSQPATSANAEDAQAQDLGMYQLGVRLIDFAGSYTLTINGFPVSRLPVMGRTAGQTVGASVQTGLIGKGNTASVRVEPYLTRSGSRLSVGPVQMRAWIERDGGDTRLPGTEITPARVDSVYAAWTERAEAQWQRYREAEQRAGGGAWALDSMRAWAGRHPMTVSTTFENEAGPDFSSVFGEEAPRLAGTPADSARLLDYAIRLRDLLEAGNAEALYEEFAPSLNPESPSPRAEVVPQIRKLWIEESPYRLSFERSDVALRKWSEGRVWELYRKPGEPLLETAGGSFREVYVAEMDGKLRVVR